MQRKARNLKSLFFPDSKERQKEAPFVALENRFLNEDLKGKAGLAPKKNHLNKLRLLSRFMDVLSSKPSKSIMQFSQI